MVNMEIDKILTEELKRHSQINSYVTSILEQEEGDAPGDIDIDVTADPLPKTSRFFSSDQ